ncbi:MAG: preprotein translocase subunit SecA [Clostridia bacterium]|nr:preprotein translocase subunit SecA [Clostridia bacterium]
MGILEKIFGSYSEKEIKKITPMIEKIESLEEEYKKMSDEELQAQTTKLKERLNKGETLEDILPEAFATVREASVRVLGMRHFRVQLIGGIILHQGRIAEMKTGEGKTLVVTLPAYLNALTGKGVHVVTVNDYLATFHSAWMGKLYKFLGLSVGLVVAGMSSEEKREAYNADITYGTNNEFGFDYLRDNMCISKEQMVQRPLHFAVVDEVDSILIDEARTPLIISGMGDKPTELYEKANKIVRTLKPRIIVEKDNKEFDAKDEEYDYVVDLKARSTSLTEAGTKKCEAYFGIESLTDVENMEISHTINQALKAYGIMKKDIDYIEKDGEILIIDEFTGRIMQGRRYSEGLHQAIEAKEGVEIARESKTLASITFQNYFRLYSKLAGMTGTAKSEENEFKQIFGLDVVEIPTNKPVVRKDLNDVVYKTEKGKFEAIVKDVKDSYEKGQPVLVGTVSIEKSEYLSRLLKAARIPHEVLNAKQHQREAEIVAQAGKFKTVTIATNMAGRGTDILLGGNPEFLARRELEKKGLDIETIEQAISPKVSDDERINKLKEEYKSLEAKFKEQLKDEKQKVLDVGGLKIIGSERHESRRIDNQLRGRAGRQGDPGETRFYISLEDDLMKLFGSDRIMALADMMGLPEDVPIEQGMVSNAIETAQKKVEGRNFSIRKSVLEYDDVMNKQRNIIYSQRHQILDSEEIAKDILKMSKTRIGKLLDMYILNADKHNDIDIEAINFNLKSYFGIENMVETEDLKLDIEELKSKVYEKAEEVYLNKRSSFEGKELLKNYNQVEKFIMLKTVDDKWQAHIDDMAHLKEGIFLRAYGQTNPIDAYKVESFDLFNDMVQSIQEDTIKAVFSIKYNENNSNNVLNKINRNPVAKNNFIKNDFSSFNTNKQPTVSKKEPVRVQKSVGRNEPCPCGSGKKYKQCCGK